MKIMYNGGLYGREALCIMGREIIKQLSTKGHIISIDNQPVKGYWSKFYNNFKKMEEDIYLLNGHTLVLPELAKKHKRIINICILECKLPYSWVDALNIPEVKEIWTISEFCKKIIEESGVKKPIKVIYVGVDKRFYKNGINVFPKDKSFKFLNICAPHCLGIKDRKGLDVLIKAFKLEFGDNPKIKLILKINSIYADLYNRKLGRQFSLQKYLSLLLPEGSSPGNIHIITNYMDYATLNNLMNSVDCGVFPARAEGFGMPQAEMIKIGKPVITTTYSAHAEFSDPRLQTRIMGLWPLDYNISPYFDNRFGEPDVEHLRKLMKQIYSNYKIERELAKKHSLAVSKFTWDDVGNRMDKFLKE